MSFVLTLWTNDPRVARNADLAGVDRIGLDLETLGKAERQKGLATWISRHDVGQLKAIGQAVSGAALFVRANPYHPGSRDEVDRYIEDGVTVIMLPNFEEVAPVEHFLRIVDGRAKVVPLVERLRATHRIHELASLGVIDEIHVGLNDLAIDLGQANRMSVLTSDAIARVAEAARAHGLILGLGGIGRAFDTTLPIASDLIYAQYARLGARGALIARSFGVDRLGPADLAEEIGRARARLAAWMEAPTAEVEAATATLRRILREMPALA